MTGCITSRKKIDRAELVGVYVSKKNKFEKWSILGLNENHIFNYKYGLGGCQDKIEGIWDYHYKTVILSLHPKYDTVFYHVPNLDQSEWKITNRGLWPTKKIDNGCFIEEGKHLKISNNDD